MFAPSVLARIAHGRFDLAPLYRVYVPFLLYEFMVLYLLARRLAMHSDVPWARRYLSALIETSIPTFVLYLHMNWMGSAQALGFAAPLAYFLFIVLSTLRLDFWLSTFTGLVAAVQLFAMAMLYHPSGDFAEAAQEPGYNIIRSILLAVGGVRADAERVRQGALHDFHRDVLAPVGPAQVGVNRGRVQARRVVGDQVGTVLAFEREAHRYCRASKGGIRNRRFNH